jgi:hypothetical protein
MFVWDKAGAISTFEVKVRHDLSALAAQLKQLFPGEEIGVLGSGKDVVISGTVSSKYVIEKAADVAAGYVAKKEDVVNMLKQQEGVAESGDAARGFRKSAARPCRSSACRCSPTDPVRATSGMAVRHPPARRGPTSRTASSCSATS